MASVYIFYSLKLNKFYTGSCNVLQDRLIQHYNKEFMDSFTSKTDDWELYISIDNLGYQESRFMENRIKKMKSKIYIHNLKKYPNIVLDLIEKFK